MIFYKQAKIYFALFSILLETAPAYAKLCTPTSKEIIYTVKQDDTLSDILYRFRIFPLWGKQGYVNRTATKNSIAEKDKISLGQKIILPFQCEEELEPYVFDDSGSSRRVVALKERSPGTRMVSNEAVATAASSSKESHVTLPESLPETPTPAPSNESNEDTQEYSVFTADLLGEYSVLAGVDKSDGTSARLLSKFNPGVNLVWGQHWNESLRTELFARIKFISFYAEKTGTELHDSDMTTTAFGAGVYSSFDERFEGGVSLEQAPTIFYRGSLVGSGLEFNTTSLLKLHAQLSYALLQRKRLSLNVRVGGSYYGNSSYDTYTIEAGSGYDAGLLMRHQFQSGTDFHCLGYYEVRNQDTSLLTLSEKSTGLQCGLSWRVR